MKIIKSAARMAVFFVLLACLLDAAGRLLQDKTSITQLKPFLEDAQEYDVLFVGDSQVLNSILPLELYHQYGITSYNLGARNSLVPMSYWRLINALDYATPRLVVFSVTDAEVPYLSAKEGEWLHEALDGFPLTLNKARAILELTDQEGADTKGVPYREIRTELFFPLLKFHSRWSRMKPEDFQPVYNRQKGAKTRVHVSDPHADTGMAAPDECLPEEGYGYAYLRKTIELCQERGIPLLFIQPPYPMTVAAHQGTHTSQKIADEYGIPMLNFFEMNRVVDYYSDCYDPQSHLNASGARKLTDFLGHYLTTHYALPDRRAQTAFAHWNDEWNAYVDEKIRVIAEEADSLRSRLMLLHDNSFSLVLTVRPGFVYDHRNTDIALQNIARAHAYDDNDVVAEGLKPLYGLDDAEEINSGYMLIVDRDAESEEGMIQEYYGIGECEFDTHFGTVFCRMDGEWIDTSITQDDEETYYFDSWEEQEEDMRLILIDRREGKVALAMAFSRTEAEQP